MLRDEAILMGRWTKQLPLGPESVCLNLGSSTREFRENTQPFIASDILQPIEQTGCTLVNCDIKSGDGIDEVGDLLDPAFQEKLVGYKPDLIICSNLLEHLSDPKAFAQACGTIAKPGGYCLFTVPRSYPYHPDPIDTMFRPSPEQLAALLPKWETVSAKEIVTGNYLDELKAQPFPTIALLRQFVRSLLPFYRPRKWYPAAHRLLWLFRSYRVSIVMMRKPESE